MWSPQSRIDFDSVNSRYILQYLPNWCKWKLRNIYDKNLIKLLTGHMFMSQLIKRIIPENDSDSYLKSVNIPHDLLCFLFSTDPRD